MWNLPNLLTLLRLGALPVVLYLLWPGVQTPLSCFWAALVFAVAGVLDMADGALARYTGQVTMIGKFLDPLVDKIFHIVVLIALLQLPGTWVPAWVVMVLAARETAVTGLRAVAAADGLVIAAGDGGKLKTVFAVLGTTALIFHYTYVISLGSIGELLGLSHLAPASFTIDFYVIGLYLTYICLVYSLVSAFVYARGFLRA